MSVEKLTQVSGIGKARAQLLINAGVETLDDLNAMSVEDLAAVKTVGMANAAKIKEAVAAMVCEGATEEPDPELEEELESPSEEETQLIEEIVHLIDPRTFKVVRKARKSLNELQDVIASGLENLKPLGRKKWLKEYVEYKVLAKKLEKNIGKTVENLEDLPRKTIKQVFRESDELGSQIKDLWKKVKRKPFAHLNDELHEFRTLIKSINKAKKQED